MKDPFASCFGEIEGALLDFCLCFLRVVVATREAKGDLTRLLFLPRAHCVNHTTKQEGDCVGKALE